MTTSTIHIGCASSLLLSQVRPKIRGIGLFKILRFFCPLAFHHHHLQGLFDLESLESMGFEGESVSIMECICAALFISSQSASNYYPGRPVPCYESITQGQTNIHTDRHSYI